METRKERLMQARNYVLYYGKGQGKKLSQYDIAIVESSGQLANEIEFLKSKNTLVIAYVTMMELGPFHTLYHMLKEADFLKVEEKKIYNSIYHTYMINLLSKRWQGLIYHVVGNLLLREGYDGIFMDTIGDVESTILSPVERKKQIDQATTIVRRLRQLYPDHLIIQNNGLEHLCVMTSEYIDGLLWENPPFSIKKSEEWIQVVVERITGLSKEHGIRLFLLHEDDGQRMKTTTRIKAQSMADKYGILYYEAAKNYI